MKLNRFFHFKNMPTFIIWASPKYTYLQYARNTCERKQAERRNKNVCRAVPRHSMYRRYIRPTDNARQTNRQ